MYIWKVAVLGDVGVGKTSFFTLSLKADWDIDSHEPTGTIEDPYRRELVVDSGRCCLETIETLDQEEDQWIQECHGFILVYSITSRSSFDRMETFHQHMRRANRTRNPVFVLVGNKCDRQYLREVSREEGAALALQFGCEFMETSAKTAVNIHRLFTDLVRLLRQPVVVAHVPKARTKGTKCVVM